MKRGKRFLENDNLFIYVGTVIFFIFAIALGIIMYMMNRTADKIENGSGQAVQQSQVDENAESASTEIGKTVEEQENLSDDENGVNDVSEEVETSTNTNNAGNTTNSTNSVKTTNSETSINSSTGTNPVDEPDTNVGANVTAKNEEIETKKEITFIKPTDGEIICEYAKDNLIYSETLKEWITHTAVDIKADKTSVIKAAADGIVKSIVNDPRYGLTVVIEHDDGYETVYSNLLTAEFVVEGEEVAQGQTIGTAGNTASFESSKECHLHFELLKDGEYLDPSIYLKYGKMGTVLKLSVRVLPVTGNLCCSFFTIEF